MKTVFISMMILLGGLIASAGPKNYADVVVDWTPQSLDQVMTMVCDDAYYTGITLTIVGTYKQDFWMKMEAPVGWKAYRTKSVIYNNQPATEIWINGSMDDATLTIYQPGKLKAVIDVVGGC